MKYKELASKIQKALLEKKKSSTTTSPEKAYTAFPMRTAQNVPYHVNTPKKGLQEAKIVSNEWNSEVKQTTHLASSLDLQLVPYPSLIPTRVQLWKLKSYLYLLRALHLLSKGKDLSSDISVLSSDPQPSQNELWADMMKPHEERQFRIGRITNYFS